MTKFFILLGVCLAYVLTVTADTTCPAATLQTFAQCEETNNQNGKQNKEAFEEAERKCYTDNSCTPCEEGRHHSGDGPESKDRECRKAVFETEHQTLSNCVEKATGYTLPKGHKHHKHRLDHHEEHREGSGGSGEHDREHHHSGEGSGEWEKFEAKKREWFEGRVKKSCNNNADNAAKVIQCLKLNGETNKPKLVSFCDTRVGCFETLIGKCDKAVLKATFEVVETAVKTCKEAEGKPTEAQLEAVFNTETKCSGLTFAKVFEGHHHHEGSGSEHEHHSGEHHSGEHHSGEHPKFRGGKKEHRHRDSIGEVCMRVKWEEKHSSTTAKP